MVKARASLVLISLCVLAMGPRSPDARPAATAIPSMQGASPALTHPTTLLWYTRPAAKWDDALPIGNGRLGGMVFGKVDAEEIDLNEDTYWSGGPYSTAVKGGHAALSEVQRLIFEGEFIRAHKLFGRSLLGRPVEQQKYQSLGSLVLEFADRGDVSAYRHQLDLETAIVSTTFQRNGASFTRDVFVSPIAQVMVVRLTSDAPGRIAFTAQLRGARNQAHSNYATDYFRIDGRGSSGLTVHGKSADYLGVAGALRFVSRLEAIRRGRPDACRRRRARRGTRECRHAARGGSDQLRELQGRERRSRSARRRGDARRLPPCPTRRCGRRTSPSTSGCSAAYRSTSDRRLTPRCRPTSGSRRSRARTTRPCRDCCSSSAATCSSPRRGRARSRQTCRASGTPA